VLVIAIGLLASLVTAVGILALVSFPYLRAGSPILSPVSGRAVARVKKQARHKPVAAVGTTWHGLVELERAVVRTWAPISAALHESIDRLETRDGVRSLIDSDAESVAEPGPSSAEAASVAAASPADSAQSYSPAMVPLSSGPVGGSVAIGRPRPSPAISGPIPAITTADLIRLAARRAAEADAALLDMCWNDDLDRQAGILRPTR